MAIEIQSSGSSGTNTGDLTLSTIGSSPNANGASLSGQVLTLQPANASFGGILSNTTQTIPGTKTLIAPVLTGAVDNSGGSVINKTYEANSGSAITLDPANGRNQIITLNSATVTVTAPSAVASGAMKEIILDLKQDATGSRVVSFSGFSYVSGVAPTVNTTASSITRLTLKGSATGGWEVYTSSTGLGVIDGSAAPAGMTGEYASSTILVGSAVSLTTATQANVTNVVLSPGSWVLDSANVTFDPAGTTTVSKLQAGVNSTSATLPTAPAKRTAAELSFTTGADQYLNIPCGKPIDITATTTYYLVAEATFATSTMVAYGELVFRRVR